MNNFEKIIKEYLKRNKNIRCSYQGCDDKSIYSHTISKKISLLKISEDLHLKYFSPKRKENVKQPYFERISIHDATGFNGFCKKHDDIFQVLDQNIINSSNKIILQLYRSLSLELYNEKIGLLMYDKIKDGDIPLELINSFHEKYKIDHSGILRILKNKIDFERKEEIEDRILAIEKIRDYMLKIYNFNEDVAININELQTLTTENMEYHTYYYLCDFQIPISISTINKLVIDKKILNFFFVVIPYSTNTIIIGVAPKTSSQFILDKINNSFSNKIEILNFIESIISSCDGWYIKPSIIDNMSTEKRDVFLNDCMFINERKFYHDYDLTIFDQLRLEIVGDKECEIEKQKIEFIPNREPYDIRYTNMIKFVEKSI